MGEWEPIETHGGDCGQALVHPGYSSSVTVGYLWRGETWLDVLDADREIHPTHWMTLPAPPEEGK